VLDDLARRGLRFTDFYNVTRCPPTRASLLTGLYPHQAGVGNMAQDDGFDGYRGRLNDRCVTIAEALASAGYRTLMSGKWHLGKVRPFWPTDRGFQDFFGCPQGGGFYFRTRENRTLVMGTEPYDPPDNWYITELITDHALELLETMRDDDRPFFLYVPHIAPHWPLQARDADIDRCRGRYAEGWAAVREERHRRAIGLGIADPRWSPGSSERQREIWAELANREEMELRMTVYAAQVEAMDREIGRLLEKITDLGRERNTLVLFLSDNGGTAEGGALGFTEGEPGARTGTADSWASYGEGWAIVSNTPFRGTKGSVYEGGIATPLIAYWPEGIRRSGEWESRPGHVMDVMPTCLELAGIDFGETFGGRRVLPLEGESLVPVFRGESRERETLFWEHQGNRAAREGRWKAVGPDGGGWELYDLETDRTEQLDVAYRHPERVRAMAGAYEEWAARCRVLPYDEVRPRESAP
jgi:arylsulfatase